MATQTFLNPVDHGEYLNFRVEHEGNTIPVKISREALDDHFGADKDQGGLLKAFVEHRDEITGKAQAKARPGGIYTLEAPLELFRSDF